MNEQPVASIPPFCSIAFKEWAVVGEALAEGRQTIILRKGGIHEGRDGFRAAHPAFWVFPTNFHQQAEQLAAGTADLLARAKSLQPPPGEFHLRLLTVVDQVVHLADERTVEALQGQHIWSESTVRQRFHYRQPGLFLLLVRVYRQVHPHVVWETPDMAGCKSWVALPELFSTSQVAPVLTAEEYDQRKAAIHAVLAK